jgi:gluconolactonase
MGYIMKNIVEFSSKIANIVTDKNNFELEVIATGFKNAEGPIWLEKEKTLLFTDFSDYIIYKWNENEGLCTFRKESGRAIGLALDVDGCIIACESKSRRISRTKKNGEIVSAATKYEGKKINSPNDVVVKSDNAIYFTDPYSMMIKNERELYINGVYRIDPITNEVSLIADDFQHPNGLAFSPDEKLLYIDDTSRQHIRVFNVNSDGMVSNGCIFAELDTNYGKGFPDGIKVDTKGNVYVTGSGGIWIFSEEGERLGIIKVPEMTLNMAWGGDGKKDLYITALTTVYKATLNIKGI